jgi:hypothetical protein
MTSETISQEERLVVRRHVLRPGEATPWHTDTCRRLTVVVSGDALTIEFRNGAESVSVPVSAGMADWDDPDERVHRGVNSGASDYEEVVVFFLPAPGVDPQPDPATRLP